MTIDKAIEIKTRTLENCITTDPNEIYQADQLSIEALQRIQHYRLLNPSYLVRPLPSETKD